MSGSSWLGEQLGGCRALARLRQRWPTVRHAARAGVLAERTLLSRPPDTLEEFGFLTLHALEMNEGYQIAAFERPRGSVRGRERSQHAASIGELFRHASANRPNRY